MIKTKLIEDGALSCDDRLDTKINNFIRYNKFKIIDIKYAGIGRDNRASALIIYEDYDNEF